MAGLSARGCGLDLQKQTVGACLSSRAPGQQPQTEGRTFRTMTAALLLVADWLPAAGGTHVAMASTGVSGRPVYNLLEGLFTRLVVHAPPLNAVPGRHTEVKDAAWMAARRRHGLFRGRFMPATPQRQRRELTRRRTTVGQERARVSNRLHAVFEDATITLAAVGTAIRGVSTRAMREARLAGARDGTVLAAFARGRRRAQRDHLEAALRGDCPPHPSCRLTESLRQRDCLDEALARVRALRAQPLAAAPEAIALLDTLPGVSQRTAASLWAAMGTAMARCPRAKHLASWAGLCPGHDDSGGKRLSGTTRHGRRWRRQGLVAAAHVAANTQQPSRAAPYRRMAARRGQKRALMALGQTILLMG
jgi:transposase